MGYIRKEYREKLQILDSCYNNNLPKKWNEFINQVKVEHNLIIKGRKGASICTNCKNEFVTNKKIGEYQKCPLCKNTYMVRSSRLKKYWFISNLILLDKVEDDIVFRYFEIWSAYNNKSKFYGFDTSVAEFARSFFNKRVVAVNDRVSKCQCNIYVNHWGESGKWREYCRNYDFGSRGYVYPYNLKEVFKNTDYKYLRLEKFLKYIGPIHFENLLRNVGHCESFETLVKLKLYNLALDASHFRSKGTFNEIFGVPKDFYSFIKRNKLDLKEMKILRILKEKNMEKIRYLSRFGEYYIKEISELISVNDFLKYSKMHKGKFDKHMYKDYLGFAKRIGLDLKNKRILFPDDLKKRHDELEKYVEINNKKLLDKAIAKRYKDLINNKFQDEKFIILPAKNVNALENESKQQSNCVRTYSERYADGSCDIYFMRLIENMKKSLVTVEVKNNQVVQSRTKYNHLTTEEQDLFLRKWQELVLQKSRV